MKAVKDPLATMTQAAWDRLTPAQRDAIRDTSQLSPQLAGLEGWRVKVIDLGLGAVLAHVKPEHLKPRRFIVGKSTGWRPIHLELATTRSLGGGPARKRYAHVTKLERVR